MYKVYQIFIMILKFDVFFQLGFSAQFLYVVVLQSEPGKPESYRPLTPEEARNILILHLILSTGASIVLPILAWWGVCFFLFAKREYFPILFFSGTSNHEKKNGMKLILSATLIFIQLYS